MPEDENVVLEEAVDNLHEAAQRIRAVSNRLRATSIHEGPTTATSPGGSRRRWR